jgi:hypothetical protein
MALNDSHEDVSLSELQWIGMPFKVCKNHFEFDEVIINYQWMPDFVYGAERETEIYALIDSHPIAPRFLAHVTENNGGSAGDNERITGFIG